MPKSARRPAQVGEAAHVLPAVVAERAHPDIERALGHVRVVSVGAQGLDERAEAAVVAVVLFAHGGHVTQAGRHRRLHGAGHDQADLFAQFGHGAHQSVVAGDARGAVAGHVRLFAQ